MIIKDVYSHKGGLEYIKKNHPNELTDVYEAINNIDVAKALSKKSEEPNKPALIFSPVNLNSQLKKFFNKKGWTKTDASKKKGFVEPKIKFADNQFREMDGIKNKVGLEVEFGKYSYMAYDMFSKMPIFKNHKLIKCGIELVVSHKMIKHMSSGVSSFKQIVLDCKERGTADIDIPVLILGFECTDKDWIAVKQIRKEFSLGKKINLVGLKGNKPGPKK